MASVIRAEAWAILEGPKFVYLSEVGNITSFSDCELELAIDMVSHSIDPFFS